MLMFKLANYTKHRVSLTQNTEGDWGFSRAEPPQSYHNHNTVPVINSERKHANIRATPRRRLDTQFSGLAKTQEEKKKCGKREMRTQAGKEWLTRAVYPHLFDETLDSNVTLCCIQNARKVSTKTNGNSPPTAVGYQFFKKILPTWCTR